MSNDRKKTFYIAQIDDTAMNDDEKTQEQELEKIFNRRNRNKKDVVVESQVIEEVNTYHANNAPQEEMRLSGIPQYNQVIEETPRVEPKERNYFVSPILGRQAENEHYDNSRGAKTGTRRYDGYRKKTYTNQDETKEKYNRNYNEYGVYDTEQYREILETGTVSDRKVKVVEPVRNDTPKEQPVERKQVAPKIEYNTEEYIEERVVEEVKPKPIKKPTTRKKFNLPPLSLLNKEPIKSSQSDEWAKAQAELINQTFKDFSYGGEVAGWIQGPTVTQFLIAIKPGTNVNKIRTFEKDLLLKLAATSIRIQDPIPGKSYAGVEIPNQSRSKVLLGNLVNNPKFLNDQHPLYAALGLDIGGEEVYVDVDKMPHGLFAGTTGSGKSVCMNSILVSLLYRNTPEQLRLILIDPKMVEFACFDEIPHLALPVISDPKRASAALRWATEEMDKRFGIFKSCHVRNLEGYNEYVSENGGMIMPSIVIAIDELADLMNVAAAEVEGNIQRLTAKARAAGIHLLVATQRPSTDIIRGSIKNNIPVRVALKVASFTDSNTIIDHGGAEKLLGYGDMLYVDHNGERRLQGCFLSDSEMTKITNYLRDQGPVSYLLDESDLDEKNTGYVTTGADDGVDLFDEIALYAVRNKTASINRIMQVFNISFNRANRLFTQFEELGIVSGTVKGKQREILVSEDELKDILNG